MKVVLGLVAAAVMIYLSCVSHELAARERSRGHLFVSGLSAGLAVTCAASAGALWAFEWMAAHG